MSSGHELFRTTMRVSYGVIQKWLMLVIASLPVWFLLNQEYSLVICSNFLGADKYLVVLGTEEQGRSQDLDIGGEVPAKTKNYGCPGKLL
jgi:hypothetical protein